MTSPEGERRVCCDRSMGLGGGYETAATCEWLSQTWAERRSK
jgi:hypothetical protein